MAMTPEARVKNAIKKYLDTIGNLWYYMPVSNGMGRVGCPDILVCFRGMFLAFEVKAPGKRANTTANQDREIRGIAEALGEVHVVDHVDQVKFVVTAVSEVLTEIEQQTARAQKKAESRIITRLGV